MFYTKNIILQSTLEIAISGFCVLFLLLTWKHDCSGSARWVVIASAAYKGVIKQISACIKVSLVCTWLVNATYLRIFDAVVAVIALLWYIWVIVAFFQSFDCNAGKTKLLWVAMLILFLDAVWMLVKCFLVTGCLCFFICIAVGCLALFAKE